MAGADLFDEAFAAHAATLTATRRALRDPFETLVRLCTHSVRNGGKIVFFGNGGSAADAQHLAAELTVRYQRDREPIPALALTTDTSVLTAIGNDLGFDRVFARQVRAVCRPGDVCIALSTSGESENVVNGLRAAKERGCIGAGLAGRAGGRMIDLASPLLVVPSESTARVQEMHILLGHALCEALERELTPA
jgi:Phosphoheptose isomerase